MGVGFGVVSPMADWDNLEEEGLCPNSPLSFLLEILFDSIATHFYLIFGLRYFKVEVEGRRLNPFSGSGFESKFSVEGSHGST